MKVNYKLATGVCCSALVLLFSHTAISQDELTEGPGVFSGEKGEISLNKLLNLSSADEKEQVKPSSSKDEFELFKRWTLSKKSNDTEYQEFQLWLQYRAQILQN